MGRGEKPQGSRRELLQFSLTERLGLQKGAGSRFSVHREGQAVEGNFAH